MIPAFMLGVWSAIVFALACYVAARLSGQLRSVPVRHEAVPLMIEEDVDVMDMDLFTLADTREGVFTIPQSRERLWREELPSLVWQMVKLMSGQRPDRDEVETQFRAYHRDNPHVYALFDKYTRYAIARGKKTYSHWNILNRLRWDVEMEASDENTEFKIANDYIALYARWWMERNPAWLDFFETKFRNVELKIIESLGREPEGRMEGLQRRRVKAMVRELEPA